MDAETWSDNITHDDTNTQCENRSSTIEVDRMTSADPCIDFDSHMACVQHEEMYNDYYFKLSEQNNACQEESISDFDQSFDLNKYTAILEDSKLCSKSFLELSDHSGSSSDELPLAALKRRLWETNHEMNADVHIAQKIDMPHEGYTEKKLQSDQMETSSDDLGQTDSSYKPSDTQNEADSDHTHKVRCKRKRFKRDTNWKKRGKNIKRKRPSSVRKQNQTDTDTLSDDSSESDGSETKEAKKTSLKENRIRTLLHNFHTKRLDKLLSSNLLERKPVPADGNCLFLAILEFLNHPFSVQELRLKVADHLRDHSNEYMDFIKLPDDSIGPEGKAKAFTHMVEQIKMDWKWDTEMSDLIPLCIANIFQRELRIFSSRQMQPVIDIRPQVSGVKDKNPILIAHIAVTEFDHYDGVKRKTHSIRTEEKTTEPSTDRLENMNVQQGPLRKEQCPQSTPSKFRAPTAPSPDITPHKDAYYKSPQKKASTRERVAKKHLWKATIRKNARAKGLPYKSKKGHCVKGRVVQPVNCSKCRFKCEEKVSPEQQQETFKTYWSLNDYTAQRQFICHHVEENEPVRRKIRSQRSRQVALSYFVTLGNERVRVCKAVFLATLNIGRKTVDTAIKGKENGTFTGKDNRGHHTPPNKTSDADL